MAHRLKHPNADTVVEVTSDVRRDALLRRGYTPVEGGGDVKPKADQKRRTSKPKPKSDEE